MVLSLLLKILLKTYLVHNLKRYRFRDATVGILVHMAGVLDSQKEILDFEDTGAIRKTLQGQKQAIVGALVEVAIAEKMLPPAYRR